MSEFNKSDNRAPNDFATQWIAESQNDLIDELVSVPESEKDLIMPGSMQSWANSQCVTELYEIRRGHIDMLQKDYKLTQEEIISRIEELGIDDRFGIDMTI